MTGKAAYGLNAAALETLCGGWPGVTRDIKWGSNLVLSVGDKMFVMTPVDGSEGGRLSFKAAEGRFLELTDQPGIIPAPYLARAHWVSVIDPRSFPTGALQNLVRDSYETVRAKLTKKAQRELSQPQQREARGK